MNSIKTFEYITIFIKELNLEFGPVQHSLELYDHLLDKTTKNNIEAVKRHIHAFNSFLKKNEEAIIKKDKSLLKEKEIVYSKNVKINLEEIFKIADTETTDVIWNHLLLIMNNINPSKETLELLKKSLSEEKSGGSDIISGLIKKMEDTVDPGADPVQSIMNLMQGGVFADMAKTVGQGLQDGSLDIGKMFGMVQGMLSSMPQSNPDVTSPSQITEV